MNSFYLAWAILGGSVCFEVSGMLALKYSDGFTHILPASSAIICFLISIWLMSISLKQIEMSSSYAIWASTSIALVSLCGNLFFAEPVSFTKIVGLTSILIGVALLNMTYA